MLSALMVAVSSLTLTNLLLYFDDDAVVCYFLSSILPSLPATVNFSEVMAGSART